MRSAASLSLAAALAACLCACGGGGGSTAATTDSSAPNAAQTQGQGPLPGHPKIAANPDSSAPSQGEAHRPKKPAAERNPSPQGSPIPARLKQKAGKAAPFLVPVGDNSIPTYGSQGSASQQSEAEAALSSYLQARAAGEWSTACARLAVTVQKQLALLSGANQSSSEGCPAAYAKLSSRAPASSRASVLLGPLTALRLQGDRAFALFYGPHEQQYMMPMAAEGGAWKVNQLEPIPWPLGAPSARR